MLSWAPIYRPLDVLIKLFYRQDGFNQLVTISCEN